MSAARAPGTSPARLGPGHLVIDGVALAVLDEGPVDAEVTVLLIHGWGSSAAAWAFAVHALSADHRVLAADLRGHGGSDLGDEPVTIRRVVEDLWTIVDAAEPQRLVVVGHSLGGTVATALAIEHPVEALVVVDPSYGADDEEMAAAPARLEDYRLRGPRRALTELDRAFAVGSDPSLIVAARHALLAAAPRALAELYASNYLDPGAVGSNAAATLWLRRRSTPTLAFYPSAARARLDDAAGASIEVWPGAGHFLHQEDPARFTEMVLRWIERPIEA